MKRYIYLLSLALAAVLPANMSAQSDSQGTNIPPFSISQWGQDTAFLFNDYN